ncbi:hypothetical protein CJF31_00006888 [Rutstroemia sp. NJR-2017a BVV2]|nr:hypothetical protein CJF31_00006888 [Rutstroemia sp. NJR-2017a BVV2]
MSQSIYHSNLFNSTNFKPQIKMSTYKPTEHDGLTKEGKPDGRVGTGEFAHGQVDPHEAGALGGSTTGGATEESTGGSTGTSSGNSGGSAKGEFAHGKVDPAEAGSKGGSSS